MFRLAYPATADKTSPAVQSIELIAIVRHMLPVQLTLSTCSTGAHAIPGYGGHQCIGDCMLNATPSRSFSWQAGGSESRT